jgi:UV DNA damage endonuclease
MIRFGLCCIFRDQPIKFSTTTATATARLPRADALARLSTICLVNADALRAAL